MGCMTMVLAGSWCTYHMTTVSSDKDAFLFKQNVEALSQNEGNGTRIKCYTSFKYELGASVVDCSNCKPKENNTDVWYNIHDYCYSK